MLHCCIILSDMINEETLILSEINLACVPPILVTELDRKVNTSFQD